MEKKLTLEQAWKHCLAMWKWIAEQCKKSNNATVTSLKSQWIESHPSHSDVKVNCFFCDYDIRHNDGEEPCAHCPGRLVSKRFDCDNKSYSYCDKPIKFYQKLLELNEKRKSK